MLESKGVSLGFCLFLAFGLIVQTFAQVFNPKFEHIGILQGLSQSTVLSLLQDREGQIWIGTRDGLNRYNGYEFEVFRHRVDDPESISGNTILDIKSDQKGDIWLVTENGLSVLRPDLGQFKNYRLPPNIFQTSDFQVVYIDIKDRIWVGGREGLFWFDPQREEFQAITYESSPLNLVSSMASAENGQMWFGTTRFGLYFWDEQEARLRKLNTPLSGQPTSSRIEALLVEKDRIVAGTYGSGLIELGKNGEIQRIWSKESSQFPLSNNNIRCLLSDQQGNLWVGTFDGLNWISATGNLVQVNYREGDPKGLSHSSVRALMRDRKGSIWVGTYFGGINLYDNLLNRFDHYYHLPGNFFSLSYNVVGSFAELPSGEILIGTERGGINYLDGESKRHRYDPNSQETVKSIFSDNRGKIWAGIFRKGLAEVRSNPPFFKPIPIKDSQGIPMLNQSIINDILEAGQDSLWLALDNDGGLHLVHTQEGTLKSFPGREALHEFLGNTPVKSIWHSGESIFMSTMGKGLVRFHTQTGEWTSWTEFELGQRRISALEVHHIMEDGKGRFWLSTNGEGVLVLNSEFQVQMHLHLGNGLLNNIVLGVMEDKNGEIWVVGINGLNHFIEKSQTFRNYGIGAGFPLEEVNEGAFFRDSRGRFFIGGNNGYVYFDPTEIHPNNFVPQLVFTGLSISNKEVLPGDGTGILEKAVNQTDILTLDYSQSVITLEFAALNFVRPENNQYAYMLEGFDEDWVMAGNRRSATYTSLPEGGYRFLVKGSNNDGVWNDEPIALKLVIRPPFWRTWWAYLSYGVLIVSGFWFIRHNAIRSAQLKHNFKLEQLERKKWKEIHDLKLNYFIDVSHEFKTPLTLIINPLEELLGGKEKDSWVKDQLKISYFNAKRLQLLVNQILEIREIETGHSKLNTNPLFLRSLLEDVIDSFKALADRRKIKLISDLDSLPEVPLLIDQDKIEKILFNLLSNAFKFTPEGGEIRLMARRLTGQVYQFEISDSGEGIPAEELPKVFDRFFKKHNNSHGAGIGLSLTKSLIQVMGGKIHAYSQLGKGSSFLLDIPFESSQETVSAKLPFIKPLPMDYQESWTESQVLEEQEEEQEEGILLFVEDNADLRKYFKENFKKDFKVITSKNGLVGLEKARKKNPVLIVSDVMMPEMDGFEFCHRIKSSPETSHIPVILLTAKDSQLNKLEGLSLGADDYLSKPFNLLELKARIKNLVANRKAIHKKYREWMLNPKAAETSQGNLDDQLLLKIHQIVDSKLDQPNLTVEFIGQEIGLSRVHIFRKIKALTGLSPSDLIKNYRITKACELLSRGDLNVSEVAYSVGFQDVHYFSKVFRKVKKMSPRAFQEGIV
ncbi:hybrid sensor histidine kinase/response regulator transcription factor [Algoriphagus confluentis]|uniref:histidine kinase n=1 Tax=Algoriphagus confluentis TaxID=1697556 RepID=A0ABQ6PIV4_9BACT|nr:two-component regulator propeller domain-containing protein [Algoriphagus confluentis]